MVGGKCYVNGPFTISSFSSGAHHYQICRSNDTTGWGGCNKTITTNSGSSFTISGSHLPSEGYRRAYYFKACDALDNCTQWSQNPETYVYFDSTPPPVPSQPVAACDATIGGKCFVNGPFVISSSSPGADHYKICRSNDTMGWGGCNKTITTNSGSSFTISGSHLPSNGYRRAYYFKACDALDNCTQWGQNPEAYVYLDNVPPAAPSQPAPICDAIINNQCYVNGPFTISVEDDDSDVDHFRACRSNNTLGWGGCNKVIASNSGPSITVSGSDLPSQGYRRAYYFQTCDQVGNCSPWGQNPEIYVYFDSQVLTCPIADDVELRPCGSQEFLAFTKGFAAPPAEEFEIHRGLMEALVAYDLERVDPAAMRREVDAGGRLALAIAGVRHELVLEPREIRAPSFREVLVLDDGDEVEVPAEAASTFSGHVDGVPGSKVRLLVHPDLVMGYVQLDGTRYFIDPAYKFVAGGGADRIVIYEEGDLRPEPGISCAVSELHEHADAVLPEALDPVGTLDFGMSADAFLKSHLREVEIATDADYEYYAVHGSNTNLHIRGVLNMVNGFYDDIGLEFRVTSQRYFTSPSADPYGACHTYGQWCEMYQEWGANRQGIQRDVAHLFSGKVLYLRRLDDEGDFRVRGTSGLLGTVCSSNAYVTSTDYNREVGLVAHEQGHAFGARHLEEVEPNWTSFCPDTDCGQDTCPTSAPGGGPVMCGHIQDPVTGFHHTSVTSIGNYVGGSGGSCLSTTH